MKLTNRWKALIVTVAVLGLVLGGAFLIELVAPADASTLSFLWGLAVGALGPPVYFLWED